MKGLKFKIGRKIISNKNYYFDRLIYMSDLSKQALLNSAKKNFVNLKCSYKKISDIYTKRYIYYINKINNLT